MQTLYSSIDSSVNFVPQHKMESRYVQRTDDYFIAYLSSHNGCNKACRFCHLTQTGQTDFTGAFTNDYLDQANLVMKHYDKILEEGALSAKSVHFNFMARGEPFSNKTVLKAADTVTDLLSIEARKRNLTSKFNFSTIGPIELSNLALSDILNPVPSNSVYYSLYSTRESFRRRWLPNAIPVEEMLINMRDWQDKGGTNVLHWALISGENDSYADVDSILNLVHKHGIVAKFNLVRYNPYSVGQGKESADYVLNEYFKYMKIGLNHEDSKIVTRVGFDVKASCGMFVV
jgi:23S rRNA (adenine2503-C2)-methyltransferase